MGELYSEGWYLLLKMERVAASWRLEGNSGESDQTRLPNRAALLQHSAFCCAAIRPLMLRLASVDVAHEAVVVARGSRRFQDEVQPHDFRNALCDDWIFFGRVRIQASSLQGFY